MPESPEQKTDLDIGHAIEIAPRIWWVGHYLNDDVFQCHVYLIENGDQSVLFDPGSKLTFPHTLKKIEEVTAFANIRYFVCHHQDPDITASLPDIDAMITRDDAVLISHWRAAVLLKHYGLKKLNFWLIEKHDWKLQVGDRLLEFAFTPYMHFPGAFCTFDHQTGTLFSSDIFGGFTENWSLYAQDESYFECMRPFHEHYIPSREIMVHGMLTLEKLAIRQIAPQHGSIIPSHLVQFMIDKLKSLDCGLFLMTKKDCDIQRLMKLNQLVRTLTESILNYRDFRQVAEHFISAFEPIIPLQSLEFYILDNDGESIHLNRYNRYHGEAVTIPEAYRQFLMQEDKKQPGPCYQTLEMEERTSALLLKLPLPNDSSYAALAILNLPARINLGAEFDDTLEKLSFPLAMAIEREAIYRAMESDRNKIYERSIRDPLTGLYTRIHMQDVVHRMVLTHARNANACFALVMVDIDFFKSVNDTYGHQTGDLVLKDVAGVVLDESREIDVPVRFGGEEFSLFIPVDSMHGACECAERLRKRVEALSFSADGVAFQVTISAGVALHDQAESLAGLMKRADMALYEAKRSGRNRVCQAQAANDAPDAD